MGIYIQYPRQHWRNEPVFRGRGILNFQQAVQSLGEISNEFLSIYCTIPFQCQGEQKTAFPFVQIHAYGK